VIFGDGTQTRDFTFVGNTVLGTLLAGASDRALAGEPVNIATGSRTSLLELTERLAALVAEGSDAPAPRPEFKPARPGEVMHSQGDIARARDLLGYEPVMTLETGLAQTVAWFRQMAAGTTGPSETL
jgi:nucleoside-diphosphate-sugar epimerase